jgi:23S rRNA (guanosine2251-2'-O)-methyltransferase
LNHPTKWLYDTEQQRNEESPMAEEVYMQQQFVAGRKPVRELVEKAPQQVDSLWLEKDLRGADISRIMHLCKEAGLRYQLVPKKVLDRLFPGHHQGVLARVFAPGYVEEETLFSLAEKATLPLVLALDQVQDPGNLGTLARTLYGLGGGGLLLPKHNSAALGEGAIKASAGALWQLHICRATNMGRSLELAREAGFTVYRADQKESGEPYFLCPVRFPAVLVLGGEDKGVRPGVRKHCDATLEIPMAGDMESLNVAQAGAMLMGHFLAQAHNLKATD